MSLGGSEALFSGEFFFDIVQFRAFWGVFCKNDDHGIYIFEITLSENANFTIYNVNNCVFSIDGVWNYAFSSKFWKMFMYFAF